MKKSGNGETLDDSAATESPSSGGHPRPARSSPSTHLDDVVHASSALLAPDADAVPLLDTIPTGTIQDHTNDADGPRYITDDVEHARESVAERLSLADEKEHGAKESTRASGVASVSSAGVSTSEPKTVRRTLPSRGNDKATGKSRKSGTSRTTRPGAVAIQPGPMPDGNNTIDDGPEMIEDYESSTVAKARRSDAEISNTTTKMRPHDTTIDGGPELMTDNEVRFSSSTQKIEMLTDDMTEQARLSSLAKAQSKSGSRDAMSTVGAGVVDAGENVAGPNSTTVGSIDEDDDSSVPSSVPDEDDEQILEASDPQVFQSENASVRNADVTYAGIQQAQPDLAQAIEAELVTANSTYDAEAERQRIKQQAEQSAQERFLASAVTAEAEVVDDEDGSKKLTRLKCYFCGAMAIVVVIIVLAVVLTGGDSGTVDLSNATCTNAFGPLNLTGGVYTGDTLQREGDFNGACQVDYEGGFGQWYFLVGEGYGVQASTCDGSDNGANSDTQVLVFSGSCSSLDCVGGGDELCGAHGSVGWMAEEGVEYFVLIRGTRASSIGNFTLTIRPEADNGECKRAVNIGNVSKSIFGSTRNHSVSESIPSCGGADESVAPGLWYVVAGDNNVKCASVTTESALSAIAFPVTTSIYSGSCGDLKCVDSVSGSAEVAWMTQNETSYFLLVHGEQPGDVGDFFLTISQPPSNGICEYAEPLTVGVEYNGTTVDACQVLDRECSAGHASDGEALVGVWYTVIGTGNLMVISTCDTPIGNASVVSHLSVYHSADGCATLACVSSAREESCGANEDQRSVQWFSKKENIYYILVQSSNPSDFAISIQDIKPDVPATCDDAILVEVDSKSYTVGSTAGLNSTDSTLGALCLQSSQRGTAGVFYKVIGTGGDLTASTCIEGTNFATNITVLSGTCESQGCVDRLMMATCDGLRSIVSWSSVEGESYYMYIHGATDDDSGRFALTVSKGGIQVANDFCSTAQEMAIGSTVSGSTTNATVDAVDLCETKETASGVWYRFTGDGSTVSASLCGEGTTFDTQLRIYRGECSSLLCVGFNDDSCGTKSEMTWMAVAGVQYHILVSGFEDRTGDFDLSLTTVKDP